MEDFNTALDALVKAVAAGRPQPQPQPGNALARSDGPPNALPNTLWGQIKEAWANPNQQALLGFGGGAQNGNDVGLLGKLVAPIPGMDPTGRRTAQGLPEAIQNTAHTISPNGLFDMAKGVIDSANRLTTPIDDNKGYRELGDSYVPYNGAKKIADAFNVAGALPLGGGLASAATRDGASVGIFGGKLAKTADLSALEKAQQAKAAGVPREQIWKDTGWFEGVDGKWRFEIDDSKANMHALYNNDGEIGQLTDAFVHDPLFNAYPSLDRVTLALDKRLGGNASFNARSNEIRVAPGNTSAVLHEAQHAIQDKEWFGAGGNEKTHGVIMADKYKAEFAPKLEAAEAAEAAAKKDYDAANAEVNAAQDALANAGFFGKTAAQRRLKAAFENAQQHTVAYGEVKAEAWKIRDRSNAAQYHALDQRSLDTYTRLAGETEARTVQARQNLTADERRARPPWLDYDVPESNQIVRYGSTGQQMSVERPIPGTALDMSNGALNTQEPGITAYHGSPHDFDAKLAALAKLIGQNR
jgi:hypothetical protein